MTPTRIGELLRTARSDQNQSVGRIANRAGVPRRELRRWEKGDGRPNPVEIEQLAGALGLRVDGLVPPRCPVAYHAGSGTLTVGDRTAAVVRRADDADGNEAVLRTYVDAVARTRGCSPSAGLQLRRDDIAALAELLDLDDVDLEARLVRLLGVTAAEASEVRRHLLGRKAALVAATAAATVLASIPITAASATNSAPVSSVAPPAATAVVNLAAVAPAAPVSIVGPGADVATTTPAPTSSDSPSSPAPLPPTTPTEHRVSPVQLPNDADGDGIDIGSALVIERGTQPTDPNTQVGDAIHYER